MPDVNLRSLAGLMLLISSALAQAPQAKQAPEVPYQPTTQVAVEAKLKLAGVTANDDDGHWALGSCLVAPDAVSRVSTFPSLTCAVLLGRSR